MGQSKTHSLVESFANIAIGYLVALFAQLIVFPLFGMTVSLRDNLLIGVIFTVVSLIRSYFLRRLFNRITDRTIKV